MSWRSLEHLNNLYSTMSSVEYTLCSSSCRLASLPGARGMEEADARLQEVLASLLNEHEGNHEPALRQTFACLHNSGLYEAQSAAEEEQREQQVLAVFRSFPFRAPAAPIDDGVDSLVEETQAPPPAYSSLVREPEEAGEVTPAQPDPENVGEDAAGAQSAPEALLPLNPGEIQDEERTCATRPEVSHQGVALSDLLAPAIGTAAEVGSSSREDAAVPEGLSSGFGGGATAVAGAIGAESLPPRSGGVEEAKGEVWGESAGGSGSGIGFPERADVETAAEEKAGGSSGFRASASADQRSTGVGGNMSVGKGMIHVAEGKMGEEFAANGEATVSSKDPESTRQNREDLEDRYKMPHLQADPPQYGEVQQTLLLNGGGDGGRGVNGHNLPSAAGASAPSVTSGARAATTAAPSGPKKTAVTDPHLKTAGQPLRHTDTVKSPTGISTDLQNKLRALKLRRKHRFLVMRIEGTEVVAETAGAPSQGPEELRAALPFSDCRYAVYDQEVLTSDGRKTSKLFFFSWLPHNATPQNKMVYLYGKVTVKQRLEGVYDVAANMFEDIETALGLEQDDEDSEIDFES